jgi:EAL domain-containing protein (putative c-di-GMP-specific phosphodiesterase class I)
VPPEEFLDIAERHGLVRAIDRWVISAAVRVAADLPPEGAPHLEVNLSADSLGDPDLPDYIAAQLAARHVAGHRIVFEVTETAAIANMDTARRFVAQLAELGCGFALDDFGAGFGSFYYLKYLPFDYLKIDGEFIRKLPASRTDQLIVASIVTAAHGLGKKAIAEYVGDQETLDLLREFGVDYAQGYYVGRPVSIAGDAPWRVPTPRQSQDAPVTRQGSG